MPKGIPAVLLLANTRLDCMHVESYELLSSLCPLGAPEDGDVTGSVGQPSL